MTFRKRARLMRVLLAGLLGGASFQVQALIEGNFSCSMSMPLQPDFTIAAGEAFGIYFSGQCTAKRAFPKGIDPTVHVTSSSPISTGNLSIFDTYANAVLPQLPLGSPIPNCSGSFCTPVTVGMKFPYQFILRGTALSTPGRRMASVQYGFTAIGSPQYAEWIHQSLITITIKAASCSLSSPSALTLNFGTINSDDLNNASRSTAVLLNCPSSLRANVTLTPSRTIIGPDYGTSETSLAGLNMKAFWSDTGNPVELSSARVMELAAGNNSLGLTFKPVLEAGKSPSGAFQSQYTLTISYL